MSKFNQKKFLLFFTIITLSVTLSLLLVGAANQGDSPFGQEGVKGEQGDPNKYNSYDIWPGETVYVAKRINENNDLEGFRAYRHLEETDRGYFIPNRTYGEAMAFKLNKPQEIIELVSCDSPEFICGDVCFVDEGEEENEYEARHRVQYYSTIAAGGMDDPEAQCWMTEYYHGLDYRANNQDFILEKWEDDPYPESNLKYDYNQYSCQTEHGNCESMKESQSIETSLYLPWAAMPSYFGIGYDFIPGYGHERDINKSAKGVQGICPDSWRVPSFKDFFNLGSLTNCIDNNYWYDKPDWYWVSVIPQIPLSIACLNDLGFNFYSNKERYAFNGSYTEPIISFYLSSALGNDPIYVQAMSHLPGTYQDVFILKAFDASLTTGNIRALPIRCMRDLK